MQKRKGLPADANRKTRETHHKIFLKLSPYIADLLFVARITSFDGKSLLYLLNEDTNGIITKIDYMRISRKYA